MLKRPQQTRRTSLKNGRGDASGTAAARLLAERTPWADEAQFHALFDQMALGVVQMDTAGHITRVNPSFCAIVGYTPAELVGRAIAEITHPEDRARAASRCEMRYLRKDGAVVWVSLTTSPISVAEGAPPSRMSIVEDITERKRREEELAERASELAAIQAVTDIALGHLALDDLLRELLERLQTLLAVDNVAVLLTNDERVLTIYQARGPEEEIAGQVRVPIGKGVAGRIAATRQPLVVDDLRQAHDVNPFLGEKLRSLVGVPLLVEDRLVGVLDASTVAPRHFTERDVRLLQLVGDRIALAIDRAGLFQAAQATQRETEARANQLATTIEALADGVVIFDARGRLMQMNTTARALLGYSAPPEYESLPRHEQSSRLGVRDEQGRPLPVEEWPVSRVLRGETLQGASAVDLILTTMDGREVRVSVTGAPVRDAAGRVVGAVCVFRDVAERRQLEREARERAAQLQATFDAMTDGVAVYDAAGRLVRMNAALRALSGVSEDDEAAYMALSLDERMRPFEPYDEAGQSARLEAPQRLQERVLAGEVLVGANTVDRVFRARNGRERNVNVAGSPVRDAAGRPSGAVLVVRDMTERRRLEQRAHWQASMLDRAHDAIFMSELGGPIVYWNQGAEQLYGFTRDEAIGQISHELLRTDLPTSAADFEATIEREGEWIGELTHTTRDGQQIIVLSRLQLLREPDGRRYVLETSRDISERRKLERRTRDALDALLEMAEAAVRVPPGEVVLDPSAEGSAGGEPGQSDMLRQLALLCCRVLAIERVAIVLVEPETGRLHPAAITGATAEQEEQWRARYADIRLEERYGTEVAARLRAGETALVKVAQLGEEDPARVLSRRYFLIAPMLAEGALSGYIGVNFGDKVKDYTQDNIALAQAVAHLVGIVLEREHLWRAREDARAQALAMEETARQMDEFLGIASHELRSPLTTMLVNLQLLARRIKSLRDKLAATGALGEHGALLETITGLSSSAERQARRQNRLVGDLLDTSRINAGKLEFRFAPCDLSAIVRQAVEEQQTVWSQRTITLDLPDQPTIPLTADADRIGQVVTNYLTNALKYSPEDGPVAVAIELPRDAERGDVARVAVRDVGPGLPPEELEQVWQRFHQAEGVKVQSGTGVGLGLGLHISKTIIERHGGATPADATDAQA
jgi:PAS domain S-box-containing protein